MFGGQKALDVLRDDIGSQLPDLSGAYGSGATLSIVGVRLEEEWTIRSATVGREATRQSLAAISRSIGVPASMVVSVGRDTVRLADAIAGALGAESLSLAVRDAVSAAVLQARMGADAVMAASQAAAAVPIIGAVVDIVLGVVRRAREALAAVEAQRESLRSVAEQFDATRDRVLWQLGAKRVLADTADWGGLWTPHGTPDPRWVVRRLRNGGIRLQVASATPDRFGAVPGTNVMSQAIEIVRGPSSRRPWVVQDIGEMFPTTGQQLSWIWGLWSGGTTVRAVGSAPPERHPALYTIDATMLEDQWLRHLYTLRIELNRGLAGSWSAQADAAIRHYVPIFGWTHPHTSSRREPTEWGRAFALWRDDNPIRVACRRLRSLQAASYPTVTSLYARPSWRGVDPATWDGAVRGVLDSPAIRTADPSNIPDSALATEARRRGAVDPTAPQPIEITDASAVRTSGGGGIRTVAGVGPAGGGGAVAAVALAGIGALAWRRWRA